MTVGTGTTRRSERNSAPLRCTISAFSFSTRTTARRDDTTQSGSKLALSKSARATRYPPPRPTVYRRRPDPVAGFPAGRGAPLEVRDEVGRAGARSTSPYAVSSRNRRYSAIGERQERRAAPPLAAGRCAAAWRSGDPPQPRAHDEREKCAEHASRSTDATALSVERKFTDHFAEPARHARDTQAHAAR